MKVATHLNKLYTKTDFNLHLRISGLIFPVVSRQQICVVPLVQLLQGRPTRGPRKGFEWPAQCFLKPSVPSVLAEVEDRSDVKTPFFLFFFSNFRDHYDFGTKSGKSEADFRREPFF